MERSTIFNGKIHYKSPFSIAMLNYQRVTILKNMSSSMGRITVSHIYIYNHYGNGIIIMENKTCLKPPTSQPWVVKTQQRWCYKTNKTWKISGFHQHSELWFWSRIFDGIYDSTIRSRVCPTSGDFSPYRMANLGRKWWSTVGFLDTLSSAKTGIEWLMKTLQRTIPLVMVLTSCCSNQT